MIDPDQIHERVTRLEYQMRDVSKDAADARFLARAADCSVADFHLELRAHRNSLNALRDTQVEHLHEMREGFAKVDERFAKVDERFDELDTRMREGFGKMAVGMGKITELLTSDPDDRPDAT